MVCGSCRSEIEPMMVICPACGARIATEGETDWRVHVRETVERHKEKKRLAQQERDERARQLSIFPDSDADDVEQRAVRERHAEIRARVERRIQKRRPAAGGAGAAAAVHVSALDAGEVSISRDAARARARARARTRPLPSEAESRGRTEPDPDDYVTSEFEGDYVSDTGGPDFEADVPDAPDAPEVDVAIDRGFSLGLSLSNGVDEPELDGAVQYHEHQQALSTPSERLLSGLIDIAFVALIQLTLFYLTTNLVSSRLGALPSNAVVAMIIVGLVMGASYFLFFWSLSGQTLGKLLTGARVVDARGGGALGFAKSALRLLGSLLALLPLGLGLIGLWTDSDRRGWHDRLAGSLVVRN